MAEVMAQENVEAKQRMDELTRQAEEAVYERDREMKRHARDHKEWQLVVQEKAREAEEVEQANQHLAKRVAELEARCRDMKRDNQYACTKSSLIGL
jgi:methyl-accepting chemotaxis protein